MLWFLIRYRGGKRRGDLIYVPWIAHGVQTGAVVIPICTEIVFFPNPLLGTAIQLPFQAIDSMLKIFADFLATPIIRPIG